MSSQLFNARGGLSVGLTGTNIISETGFGTFPVGITASGATFTGNVAMNSTSSYTGLASFASGITASGATFMGNIYLQNAEYIRNTTNGQMDFMPAPAGSTAFGFYMDMTSWSYGVVMGTIRSSDGAKNTGGYFRFDVPLTTNDNVFFQLGSDGHYRFYRTTTGNDTAQFGVQCDGSQNSGAYAFLSASGQGNANRSPTTKHANPNVYIYANGVTSANDFIRAEHDTINGNIVSGGTSGILIQPGSGWLGVSGGISASGGIIFTGTISLNGQTFTNVVSSYNGLTGGVAGVMGPVGVTSGNLIHYTFPDGVTTTQSLRPWYQSAFYIGRVASTAPVVANRTYYILQNAPRGLSLTSIRSNYGVSSGITGELHFSVWTVDPLTGFPDTRLYVSSSQVINTNFSKTTVTNSSGLVRVNGGLFYLAVSFSNTPTMYGHGSGSMIHTYGSGNNYADGYNNHVPVQQTSGFTAPTSINQSGTTFAFVAYTPSTNPIPILEWQAIY